MRSASKSQKIYRYLLPVALVCLLVALVSFSGCITGLPGLSGISLPGSGSSAGTSTPPAYDTVQVQATQVQTTGTSAGSCRQGLTSCSGNCVDITLDIGNCGGCGMVCPTNARCNGGACYCKDGYEASADGTCTHVNTPAVGTGNTGQDPQFSCADYPGTTYCNDGYCWYLTEDNHCGACGNACSSDQSCVNGACTGGGSGTYSCTSNSDCAPGQICFLGHCGNLQTDESHCGSCSISCGSAQICLAGQCRINTALLPRKAFCMSPNSLCDGDCVNTQTDAANCGSCGNPCATNGGYCSAGVCHCPTGYLTHNGACTKIASIGDQVVVKPIVRKYIPI
jgi:hypothetical protein